MGNQGDTGRRGEGHAAAFLRRRGYSIVVLNWRNPRDLREEIDIVCRDGDALVFVEVKTRAGGALVPGYWSVDRRKRRALRRAFSSYLRLLRHKPPVFRFDVVEVEDTGGPPLIRHFENIPLFDKHKSC